MSPPVLSPLTFKSANSLGLAHASCVHGLGAVCWAVRCTTMQAKANSWGGKHWLLLFHALKGLKWTAEKLLGLPDPV